MCKIPVRFLTKDREIELRKVDTTWLQERYRFVPDKYLRLIVKRQSTFKGLCENYQSVDIYETENYRLEEIWYKGVFSHYYYVHESISIEHFSTIVADGYLTSLERFKAKHHSALAPIT